METYIVSEEETAEVIASYVRQLRALAKAQAFATVLFDYMEQHGTEVEDFRKRLTLLCDRQAKGFLEEIQYCFLNGVAASNPDEEESSDNVWLSGLMCEVLAGDR